MSTTPPEPYRESAPPPAYTPPPAGYPADAPTGKRAKGPAGLGIVAFVAALLGAIIGGVLAYFAGTQIGGLAQWAEVSSDGSSVSLDYESLPAEGQQVAVLGGILTFAAFASWGVLALWGFIQGIIAVVKNRGRAWGIFAIVLAVLGVIAVSVLYGTGVAVGISPFLT